MEAAESSYRMNGAALGALLHTVKTAGRQVDGFLFGVGGRQPRPRLCDNPQHENSGRRSASMVEPP